MAKKGFGRGSGSDLIDALGATSLPNALKIELMKLFRGEDFIKKKRILDRDRKRTGIKGKKNGGKVRAMKNGGAVMNGRGPKCKGQT